MLHLPLLSTSWLDTPETFQSSTLCPCIAAADAPAWSADFDHAYYNASLGADIDLLTYGIGCAAHDNASLTCTNRSLACSDNIFPVPNECEHSYAWCADSWCYVDPSCELARSVSFIDLGSTRVWSYAACGTVDRFTMEDSLSDQLRAQVLRVGFRSNTGGWTGAYHPSGEHGVRDSEWYGPTLEVFMEMAEQAGFLINITEPPDEIKANSGSASNFSQCVYAVSLGYLDLCIGMFVQSNQRISWTQMVPLQAEPLYLATKSGSSFTFPGRGLGLITDPFEKRVWVLLFATVLGISYVFALQERELPGSMFHAAEDPDAHEATDDTDVSSGRSSPSPMWRKKKRKVRKRCAGLVKSGSRLDSLMEGTYFAIRSLLNSTCEFAAVSWGGRLTTLGFGLFVFFTFTVYSSTLTTQMVTKQVAGTISSFNSAVVKGVRICGSRTPIATLIARYPDANWVLGSDGEIGLIGRSAVFEALEAAECDAGLVYAQDLANEQALGNHCDVVLVGQPVINLEQGIPVTASKADAIAYWVQRLKSSGDFDQIMENARPSTGRCALRELDVDATQVTIDDFFGQCLMAWCFTVLGFLVSYFMGHHGRAVTGVHVAGSITADRTSDEISTIQRTVRSSLSHQDSWKEPGRGATKVSGPVVASVRASAASSPKASGAASTADDIFVTGIDVVATDKSS